MTSDEHLIELQRVFQAAPIGLCYQDRELRYRHINEWLARINGFPVEAHLGRTIAEIQPELAPDVEPVMRRVIETGEAVLETRVDTTTAAHVGRTRNYLVSYLPHRDDAGEVLGVIAVVQDITERVRTEERNRALVEAIPDLVLRIAGDGTIVDFVPATAAAGVESTMAPERTLGRRIRDILPADLARKMMAVLEEALETGSIQTIEYQLPAGETVRDFEARVIRSTSDETVWIARDVSERKRAEAERAELLARIAAEEERRRLDGRLQQAQKMESLGILAGGVAHDFNNLLVGILGNAELALRTLPAESPVAGRLRDIEVAAHRAADLTHQMLAYSGKGRFVVEPIDVNALVEEMAHLLETVISSKAVLRLDLEADLPPVEADATQIRQVAMNLLTNASDALGGQPGEIRISTRRVAGSGDAPFDVAPADVDRHPIYVAFSVADSGCGMDPETRTRMFDPFFSTKFAGRGLGLAAVLGIVRGHRGGFRIQSEPGQGTVFEVLLPAAEAGRRAGRPVSGPLPAISGWSGEGTILVVDDEEMVREVARSALVGAGFEVETASDGVEALRLFEGRAGAFRAVLLDLTMPRMDGLETFRALRRVRPDVPIVLTSGYTEQVAAQPFAGQGLAGFIQKPFRSTALIGHIRQILEGDPGQENP